MDDHEKTDNPKGYADYEATPYKVLIKMLEKYPFDKTDCFADFGCGKGRVICFSANNGCNNVIGIEYNKKIFEDLLQNVKKIGGESISVINQKAEEWHCVPELNRCFFFNPFYLKHFIKVYYNILHYSKRKTIHLFLYDAAVEYQKFLNKQKDVCLVDIIQGDPGQGNLMIYIIKR